MTLWSRLASGLSAAAAATTLLAAPGSRTENVVLITTDGLRWQEVFGGAEESLMTKEAGGVSDAAELRRAFWRDTPAARREALLPFLTTVLARQGQLYGNATRGSVARVTNGHNFSYPGYNELLSGRADPRIDSNDKKANPNVTVLEWLNGRPPYRGKVAALCSWDVFPWIINRERSGVLVNAGFEPVTSGDRPRLAMLVVLLGNGDVGRVAERAIRSKRADEAWNAIRVRRLPRRKHAPVNQRQVALLHLSPLPRHALPESPVVIVIARASVERDVLAGHIERAVEPA